MGELGQPTIPPMVQVKINQVTFKSIYENIIDECNRLDKIADAFKLTGNSEMYQSLMVRVSRLRNNAMNLSMKAKECDIE